jgi:uncharacterized protein YceK
MESAKSYREYLKKYDEVRSDIYKEVPLAVNMPGVRLTPINQVALYFLKKCPDSGRLPPNEDRIMKISLFIFIISIFLSGCATIDTITKADSDSPIFFSGTRLDVTAQKDNKIKLMKYNTPPPRYPLIDLPFSFLADLFISPLTGSVALYETIFE